MRVHNLCLIASDDPKVVFKHVDADCVYTVLTQLAAARALLSPLGDPLPWLPPGAGDPP